MLRMPIAILESIARRVLCGGKSCASRISCDRNCRCSVVSAFCYGLFCRTADGDHTLRRVHARIEPCDITHRKFIETSDRTGREVRAGHFVRKRPRCRCDEQRAVHWLAHLSQIDELSWCERNHVQAPVRPTSALA